MLTEEELDNKLAKEAAKYGWAEHKTELAARIIKYVVPHVDEKDMREKMRDVMKYLENLRIE